MRLTIKQKTKRLDVLNHRLRSLSARTQKQVAQYLLTRWYERFDTETDPGGNRWQPLKPSTLNQKIAKGQSRRILQATGQMRNSAKIAVTRSRVTIYSEDPKLPFHQLGTSRLPQREVLGLNDKDRENIITLYKRGLI